MFSGIVASSTPSHIYNRIEWINLFTAKYTQVDLVITGKMIHESYNLQNTHINENTLYINSYKLIDRPTHLRSELWTDQKLFTPGEVE